jgi:hypothetical protein
MDMVWFPNGFAASASRQFPTCAAARMLKNCPQHQWINQRSHETRTATSQAH